MRLFPISFFTLALSITGGSLLPGHATANTVATTAAEQLYQPQPAQMQPQLATTGKQQVGVTSLGIINPAQFESPPIN
ncbi:hypothetical protein [Rheinheimera mangrovi]|uniref:hypothetical protein n=1 Tax=Rheinheimera mangrovi TaxID=2498451 RepID=UPI000F8D3265|nr:hypothetical protein [Rheinheimera mangrovi]